MVAERMTCVGLERARSSRVFSPTGVQFVAPAHKSDDGAHVHQGGVLVGGKWSPLRRRSQSQNQLRRALSPDASPPSYQLKASVSPLALTNLPLPSFSDTRSIICSNDKRSTSSSGKQTPKPNRPVQLVPLKRGHPPDIDTGNQDETNWEDDENPTTTTSEDTENSSDNQIEHLHQHSIVAREKKHFATVFDSECVAESPQSSSPRPTFLPRLATLDLVGDSHHLLRHSSSSSVSPSKKHWSKIDRICDEILTTERSYVRDLRTLVHHFFTPLQEYAIKYTINLGAMSALHASIRTILHIHRELLRQMTKGCPSDMDNLSNKAEEGEDNDNGYESDGYDDDWLGAAQTASTSTSSSTPRRGAFDSSAPHTASVLHVAAAFDFTIEFMKVYAFYCSIYLSAKDELAMLQKKYPRLNALTTELDEHACRHLHVDIVSFMIKPVQRICRYPLLFRELLKNATSSKQAEVIESTLCKIERVSTHVNEKVREAQNNARLYELHQTIDPKAKIDLLQPSRTLLSEMPVRVVSLDMPCWPSFLPKLGRKRPWRSDEQQSDCSSRRDSVETALSSPLLSSRSPHSSGFMSLSPSSSIMRPPLLRRRSSGEKLRLILLSDVLLMARKQEEKLKIKRQLCLSCAHITDTSIPTGSTPTAQPRHSCSFTMEVSKVGRCNCHQLTLMTLKRFPTDLLGARQSKQISPQSTTTTATTQQQQKPSGFFRGSEFASPFRSTKRYIVTCESEQKKTEFVASLQSAIARCARVQQSAKPLPAFPRVSGGAKFSGRFWRSLKPQAAPQQQQQPELISIQTPISQPKSPAKREAAGNSSPERKLVESKPSAIPIASNLSANGKNDELEPQDPTVTDGLDLV